MEMTDASLSDLIEQIDFEERGKFEAKLADEIDNAAAKQAPLSICLLYEVDAVKIYPAEQNAKSILRDATDIFRSSTGATGAMLFYAFDRIGLIQRDWTREMAQAALEKFFAAVDGVQFHVDPGARTAQFRAAIAAYPEDGATAPELMAAALSAVSD
jgi:hypothetical protein